MANDNPATVQAAAEDAAMQRIVKRRSFLKGIGIAGAALSAGPLLTTVARAQQSSGSITQGDAAILRFLAVAEIIESDLWLQYAELGGVQDNELPTLASQLIPGYPNTQTGGNAAYTKALSQLDGDMPQYIHDNTEDELTHEVFINAYLASKGADTVNLDRFRTLPSSQATGANKTFGRLTNLMQLSVDTSWWTRYRSRTQNPPDGACRRQTASRLHPGDCQHGRLPLRVHRAGWHEPLPLPGSEGDQSGGFENLAQHWRNGDMPLSDLARQGGQCASFDCR